MKITDRDAALIMLLLGISKPVWENNCLSMEEHLFTRSDVHDLLGRLLAFRMKVSAAKK